MIVTRSSAYRSSQGPPEQNSGNKTSSTMIKSSGLSIEPWWTPTFISNSSLYPSSTRTQLRALAYIPWTIHTIHSSTPSFLSSHQNDLLRHLIKHILQVYWKLWQSLLLVAQRYFSCSCLTTNLLCLCLGRSQTGNRQLTPTVWWGRPQSSTGLSWPALSAWDCGSCPCPMHPHYPCRGRQWNASPSPRYLAIANDCSCKVTDYGVTHVTGCSYQLHHYAWWAWCFARLHLRDSLLNHINGDWNGWAFHL